MSRAERIRSSLNVRCRTGEKTVGLQIPGLLAAEEQIGLYSPGCDLQPSLGEVLQFHDHAVADAALEGLDDFVVGRRPVVEHDTGSAGARPTSARDLLPDGGERLEAGDGEGVSEQIESEQEGPGHEGREPGRPGERVSAMTSGVTRMPLLLGFGHESVGPAAEIHQVDERQIGLYLLPGESQVVLDGRPRG